MATCQRTNRNSYASSVPSGSWRVAPQQSPLSPLEHCKCMNEFFNVGRIRADYFCILTKMSICTRVAGGIYAYQRRRDARYQNMPVKRSMRVDRMRSQRERRRRACWRRAMSADVGSGAGRGVASRVCLMAWFTFAISP